MYKVGSFLCGLDSIISLSDSCLSWCLSLCPCVVYHVEKNGLVNGLDSCVNFLLLYCALFSLKSCLAAFFCQKIVPFIFWRKKKYVVYFPWLCIVLSLFCVHSLLTSLHDCDNRLNKCINNATVCVSCWVSRVCVCVCVWLCVLLSLYMCVCDCVCDYMCVSLCVCHCLSLYHSDCHCVTVSMVVHRAHCACVCVCVCDIHE